jgi:epoxyqueuosine reductase
LKKQTIETGSDRAYQDWAFGCDICQDVCPWNRFSHPHQEAKFKPIEGLLTMSKDAWLEMEETSFKARFKQSPLLRSKLNGIKRNIEYLNNQEQ